jgi:hypothetical protein
VYLKLEGNHYNSSQVAYVPITPPTTTTTTTTMTDDDDEYKK